MKKKLDRLPSQLKRELLDSSAPLRAARLADTLACSVNSIHRAIRLMRQEGIGIHSTRQGYVLSEFATKAQDTAFLRRLFARRLSDQTAIAASSKHIERRWKGVSEYTTPLLVLRDRVGIEELRTGLNIMDVYRKAENRAESIQV